MKRKLHRYTSLILIICIMWSIFPYETQAIDVTTGEMNGILALRNIEASKDSKPVTDDDAAKYSYIVRNNNSGTPVVNNKGAYFNVVVYKYYNNIIVYGERHNKTGEKCDKYGEYRYLGYDIYGDEVTNDRFANDFPPDTTLYEEMDWQKVPGAIDTWTNKVGSKIEIQQRLLTYIPVVDEGIQRDGYSLTKILSKTAFNDTDRKAYIYINAIPTLASDGSVRLERLKSGSRRYNTFTIPKFSFDPTVTVSTDKTSYTIGPTETEVTAQVTVTANLAVDTSLGRTPAEALNNVYLAFEGQNKLASIVNGTASATFTKTFKRDGDGLKVDATLGNNVTLEGSIYRMESIYGDTWGTMYGKTIKGSTTTTVYVKPMADALVNVTATPVPDSVKFANANISVRVNVSAALQGYTDVSNINDVTVYAKFDDDPANIFQTKTLAAATSVSTYFDFTIPASKVTADTLNQKFKVTVDFNYKTAVNNNASTRGTTYCTTYVYKTAPVLPPPPVPTNKPPVAVISSPYQVKAGDDVSVDGLNSYDEDGSITNYSWNTTSANGSISGSAGSIWYPNEGTYSVGLTVTDNQGSAGYDSKSIIVMPPYPEANITTTGTLKENRKITIDASKSTSPVHFPMVWPNTTWGLSAVSGNVNTDIKYSGLLNGNTSNNILIKRAGTDQVSLTVANSKPLTNNKTINIDIAPDKPPVADFSTVTTVLRDPQDTNYSKITINDTSYSTDNDYIQNIILTVSYDSDNNGSFNNGSISIDASTYLNGEMKVLTNPWGINMTATVYKPAGKPMYVDIRTKDVGKYYVDLKAIEGFGQETIPEFITAADYRYDDTTDKPAIQKTIEVINLAPVAGFNLTNKRKVQLEVGVGNTSQSDIALIQTKMNSILLPKLNNEGLEASINVAPYSQGIDVENAFAGNNQRLHYIDENGVVWVKFSNSTTFTKVDNVDKIKKISFGSDHILMLRDNGELWASSNSNLYNERGFTTASNSLYQATKVPIADIVDIASYNNALYAINKNGVLYGWGYNSNWCLGLPNSGTTYTSPTVIAPFDGTQKKAKSVAPNYAILATTGEVYKIGVINANFTDRPRKILDFGTNVRYINTNLISTNDGSLYLNVALNSSGTSDAVAQKPISNYKANAATGAIKAIAINEAIAFVKNDLTLNKVNYVYDNTTSTYIFDATSSLIDTGVTGLDDNITWLYNPDRRLMLYNKNNKAYQYNTYTYEISEFKEVPSWYFFTPYLQTMNFKDDFEHYFIDVSDVVSPELTDSKKLGTILNVLLNKSVSYVAFGTDTNRTQRDYFITQNDGNGIYINNTNLDTAVDKLTNYILGRLTLDLVISVGNNTTDDATLQSKINSILKPKLALNNINANILIKPTRQSTGVVQINKYYYSDGFNNGYLTEYDHATNTKKAVTSRKANLVNVSPDGKVYYFVPSTGIYYYNPANGANVQVVTISASTLYGITISPDGKKIYFNDNGNLKVYDLTTSTVTSPGITLPGYMSDEYTVNMDVAPDGKLWYINNSNVLSYYNPTTNISTSVSPAYPPKSGTLLRVAPNGNVVYRSSSGILTIFDPAANTCKVYSTIAGNTPNSISYLTKNSANTIYFNDNYNGYSDLYSFDIDSGTGSYCGLYQDLLGYTTYNKLIYRDGRTGYFVGTGLISSDANPRYTDYPTNQLPAYTYTELQTVLPNLVLRPMADHMFVDLNNTVRTELNDATKRNNVLDFLRTNETDYIGLGTATNKTQIEGLVTDNYSEGIYIDNTNLDTAMTSLGDYIVANIRRKTPNIYQYRLLNEEVIYNTTYADIENDPIHSVRWKYIHDELAFDSNLGKIDDSGQYRSTPYPTFNKTGKYEIYYGVRDNPKDSILFDNYRLWSNEELSKATIYVHRKPIASYMWTVLYNSTTGKFTPSITDTSEDLDHISRTDKGIVQRQWKWKLSTDVDWRLGTPPELIKGNTYLVELMVQDLEGVWSEPYVQPIEVPDLIFDVNPPYRDWANTDATVNITTNWTGAPRLQRLDYKWTNDKNKPTTGWTTNTSYSFNLTQTLTGEWFMHISAQDTNGVNYYLYKGPYRIDKIAPTITADKTSADSNSPVSVNVTIADTGGSGIKDVKYLWSQSTTKPTTGWNVTNGSFSTIQDQEGTWYLHIEATDNAGNITYGYLGSYKVNTFKLQNFRVVKVRDLQLESYYLNSLTGNYDDKPMYVNSMAIDPVCFESMVSGLTKGYLFEFEIDSTNFNESLDTIVIEPHFYTADLFTRDAAERDLYWEDSRHQVWKAGQGGHSAWNSVTLTSADRAITGTSTATWRGDYLIPGTSWAVPLGTIAANAKSADLKRDIIVNFQIKGYKAGVMKFDYNVTQWPIERTVVKNPYQIGDVIKYLYSSNNLDDIRSKDNR